MAIAANSQKIGEATGCVVGVSDVAQGAVDRGKGMSEVASAAIAQAEAKLIGNPDHAPLSDEQPGDQRTGGEPEPDHRVRGDDRRFA